MRQTTKALVVSLAGLVPIPAQAAYDLNPNDLSVISEILVKRFARKVLAWQLSNTMETEFCVDALEEAMARYGKPEIFNSDPSAVC